MAGMRGSAFRARTIGAATSIACSRRSQQAGQSHATIRPEESKDAIVSATRSIGPIRGGSPQRRQRRGVLLGTTGRRLWKHLL